MIDYIINVNEREEWVSYVYILRFFNIFIPNVTEWTFPFVLMAQFIVAHKGENVRLFLFMHILHAISEVGFTKLYTTLLATVYIAF